MNRKIAALSVTAVAASALTCGLTLTGNAAADNKFHTVHYDAKTVSLVKLDKFNQVSTVDLKSRHIATAGDVEGAAVFTCRQNTVHSKAVHCHTAIALKGGILFGHAKLSYSTFRLTGDITDGSGAYKGAHGTFFAVSDAKHRSIITIKYKV